MIQTVQHELWEVVHFDSVAAAERALATFFADYNHRRAHLGIGSLVPADRFYGRWPEVIAELAHPERRLHEGLDVLADTWQSATGQFAFDGALARSALRRAIDDL